MKCYALFTLNQLNTIPAGIYNIQKIAEFYVF